MEQDAVNNSNFSENFPIRINISKKERKKKWRDFKLFVQPFFNSINFIKPPLKSHYSKIKDRYETTECYHKSLSIILLEFLFYFISPIKSNFINTPHFHNSNQTMTMKRYSISKFRSLIYYFDKRVCSTYSYKHLQERKEKNELNFFFLFLH